jgi:hypothetical protein
MARDIFHDRERAEEAAYFSQRDARLIEKLRERARLGEIAKALAEKLQVDDPQLLDRIANLGVTLETGAAFILAPLVEIAWADGHVSDAEHATILRLAENRGVAPGSADMEQLIKWLAVRPPRALFDAALDAIKLGLSVLPRPEAEHRIRSIMDACKEVAELGEDAVSGGLTRFLHLDQERPVLREIRRRLTA